MHTYTIQRNRAIYIDIMFERQKSAFYSMGSIELLLL